MNRLNLNFLGITPDKKEAQADIPPPNSYIDPRQLTRPKNPTKSGVVNKLSNMKETKNKFEITDGESVKDIVKKVINEKPSLKELRKVFQSLVDHYEEASSDEF